MSAELRVYLYRSFDERVVHGFRFLLPQSNMSIPELWLEWAVLHAPKNLSLTVPVIVE